jgi:hypothetical protein
MEPGDRTTAEPTYPVRFAVEYPDRDLNRLTTAFRLIVAIPIVIVLATIGGAEASGWHAGHTWAIGGGAGCCSCQRS